MESVPSQIQSDKTKGPLTQRSKPRNPIACERCRTSKTRCCSSGRAGICQRCFRARLSCISRSVQHPKRTRRRVQEAELNEASPSTPSSALLSQSHEAAEFHLCLPSVEYPDVSNAITAMRRNHGESFDQALPLHNSGSYWSQSGLSAPLLKSLDMVSPRKTSSTSLPQIIEQRALSIERAKDLLCSFHNMSAFFPFVVVPEAASVQSMARHHPFLLLALLTAASATDVQLHHQLDYEFRRILSVKVVVEGQKSLDFLQGLLIYIAWYPSYLKLGHQQLFMYLNLAISLAIDLGLDQNQQEKHSIFPLNHTFMEGLPSDSSVSRPAQRAYLGCFYLSSSIADIFSKPNALKFNDVLEQYGEAMATVPEYPNDMCLLPLVKSQEICERLRESLQPQQSAGQLLVIMPFNAEANGRAFQIELDKWRNSLPGEVAFLRKCLELPSSEPLSDKISAAIALTERYLNLAIYCYNLMLLRTTKRQQEWISSSSGYLSVPDLWRCLEAVKKFLEFLLSLPVSQFRFMTCTVWGRVIQVIVVLSRLSFPIPASPNWNSQAARDYAPLVMYLDCLCYRLQSLSKTVSNNFEMPAHPDAPFLFKIVLETLKESHERRIAQDTLNVPTLELPLGHESNPSTSNTASSNSHARFVSHCPMMHRSITSCLDGWQAASNNILLASNDVDLLETSQNTTPRLIYHDMWATMTMSWAVE